MALIHCTFYSHTLDLMSSIYVILPQPAPAEPGGLPVLRKRPRRYPVLYLLHGLSDDHTVWQRRTSIERYVEGLDLAVVMPAVGRSFYTDMASGLRYWTYISEELPLIVQALFPISSRRQDTFVAGLSMGGYGAFKLALSHPDRFAAAASLSGALDMSAAVHDPDPDWRREMRGIFGDMRKFKGSGNDLFALAEKVAHSAGPQPHLYQWCGTEDFLYPANQRFRDHATQLGLDLMYEEGPGDHVWQAWDDIIQRVLEWIEN